MTNYRHTGYDDDFAHEDVLEQSRRYAQHLGMKDSGWFGLDLDKETRNVISPLWVGANAYAKGKLEHKVLGYAEQALHHIGPNSALHKVPLLKKALSNPKYLTGAFFSILLASPTLPALISPLTTWRKDRADMAKIAAPILKDMAADGMAGSIGSVTPADNEVLFAHRMRVNKTLSHLTVNSVLQTAASQIGMIVKGEKHGRGHDAGLASKAGDAAGMLLAVPPAVDMLVGKFTDSRNKELTANRSSCSAFQLITNLDEQLKKRAKQGGDFAGDISFPKVMGNRSTNLANYIATTIRAHGADMERLMPEDYSQLRDALNPQLKEVSQVLARAIESGDLAPLSLIRLIGEGKVIKQQGRALASVDELKALIGKHAGKQTALVDIDPKEYLKMAVFKDKELKETLGQLEGNERAIFASFFPDAILKQAGLGVAEIKTIREETAPMYEKNLANLLAGIAAQPDDALKAQGMADSEIRAIKEAAATLHERGEKAVHSMRANAANPTGIELPLMNAAMGKISEPHYIGKMLSEGNKALAEAGNKEGIEGEGHRNRPRHSHDTDRDDQGEHVRRFRTRSDSAPFPGEGHHRG